MQHIFYKDLLLNQKYEATWRSPDFNFIKPTSGTYAFDCATWYLEAPAYYAFNYNDVDTSSSQVFYAPYNEGKQYLEFITENPVIPTKFFLKQGTNRNYPMSAFKITASQDSVRYETIVDTTSIDTTAGAELIIEVDCNKSYRCFRVVPISFTNTSYWSLFRFNIYGKQYIKNQEDLLAYAAHFDENTNYYSNGIFTKVNYNNTDFSNTEYKFGTGSLIPTIINSSSINATVNENNPVFNTQECWFKIDKNNLPTSKQILMSNLYTNTSGTNFGSSICIDNNSIYGEYDAYSLNSSNNTQHILTTLPGVNISDLSDDWHHVAISHGVFSHSFLIDGVLCSQSNVGMFTGRTGNFRIGHSQNGEYTSCYIDDPQITMLNKYKKNFVLPTSTFINKFEIPNGVNLTLETGNNTSTFVFYSGTNYYASGINNTVSVKAGSKIDYIITTKGFKQISGSTIVTENTTLDFTLEEQQYIEVDMSYDFSNSDYAELMSQLSTNNKFIVNSDLQAITNNPDSSITYHGCMINDSIGFMTPDMETTLSVTGYVSSEGHCDFGAVYCGTKKYIMDRSKISNGTIDGFGQYLIRGSGIQSSNTYTMTLQPNTYYYLNFAYGKDGSSSIGQDKLIIENIKLAYVPGAEPPPPQLEKADLYLRGAINSWESDVNYQFTYDPVNDLYFLENVEWSGEYKFASSDWSTIDFGGSYSMQELPLNTETSLTRYGSNLYCDETISASRIEIKINGTNGTVKIITE